VNCRELFLDYFSTQIRIKTGTATKHINVDAVVFGVRVSAEVAFGQNKHTCSSNGLKLVKGAVYHRKLVPFSNSLHNILEVLLLGNPHAFNVSHEVAYLDVLMVLHFIYDQTDCNHKVQKTEKVLKRFLLVFRRLDEVGDAQCNQNHNEKHKENRVKINLHLLYSYKINGYTGGFDNGNAHYWTPARKSRKSPFA
jgi:hypothetical protein